MKPSITFLLLLSLVVTLASNAQQQRVLAMSVVTTTPSGDTTAYGVPIIDSSTVFTTMMNIVLVENPANETPVFRSKLTPPFRTKVTPVFRSKLTPPLS